MSSETTNHLNHSTWECKYHVVFTPKYRKKELYGYLRRELREVFHRLSRQKECSIEEGHLMPDHVHMLLSIPPKHSVAHVIGFMKGKSSIWIAQNIKNRRRNFAGKKLDLRGTSRTAAAILRGINSGHVVISSRRSAQMSARCELISKRKSNRTNASTTCLTGNL